jgi:exonuclease III
VVEAKNIGNRAHVLALQKTAEDRVSYIVANVYAPNPNNKEKIDFFEKVLDDVLEFEAKFDCSNVILAGDFNLIFKENECKNRLFTNAEKRISKSVANLLKEANLEDIWRDSPVFTWRRPNTDIFSTIDRIFYNKSKIDLVDRSVDWSLSMSDHAAIDATFKYGSVRTRSKITRLDPSILKDPQHKLKFETEFN